MVAEKLERQEKRKWCRRIERVEEEKREKQVGEQKRRREKANGEVCVLQMKTAQ